MALRKFCRCGCVIQMRVSHEDFFERQIVLRHRCENPIEITTRIDDGGTTSLLAPDDGAVLLERSDRDDLQFHADALRP